jgi:hypothetical protein
LTEFKDVAVTVEEMEIKAKFRQNFRDVQSFFVEWCSQTGHSSLVGERIVLRHDSEISRALILARGGRAEIFS